MDYVIGTLSPKDAYRVRDLLRSVAIFGATGSGKTRGSGLWLGRSVVNYPRSSGLILAAKPHEDVKLWKDIFDRAGRTDDLLIFEPDGGLRFNFLNYVVTRGGDTRQITRCITTIGETLRAGEQRGDSEGKHWESLQEQYLYNAVGVMKLAKGSVNAPELQRFITGAATCREELSSEEWRKGFHNECLQAAYAKAVLPRDKHDVELHIDYWLGQIPGMADRTRSSIEVGVRR
ncbi:MAG: hypothetical protein JSS02_09440, partial [Planctomycetes bacterium]|nr:hypothetical protein [Planctomycetota bacterium]